jgi:two-component system chemotaxis sensor kinase CheA
MDPQRLRVTMNPTDAGDAPLLAIFAGEARAHLAHIDAGVAALAQPGAAAQLALASILEALHTLAGAARAVERDDLEWLCRALEGVFMAAASANAGFDGEQCGRLHRAVALAHLLADRPDRHTRSQALALITQLDANARQAPTTASASAQPLQGP